MAVSNSPRRRWLQVGAVGVAIVVAAVVWLLSQPDERRDEVIGHWPPGTSQEPAVPFTEQRGAAINAAITSRDRGRFGEAVALPADPTIAKESLAALSDLPRWVFDMATVRYLSDDAATVSARSASTDWQVYLILDTDVWKIAATERLPA
ncbi:hypothetical protein ACWFPY_36635 [Nocardia fluminea]